MIITKFLISLCVSLETGIFETGAYVVPSKSQITTILGQEGSSSTQCSHARTTDTQWSHKSKISEKLGRCGRQNMIWPYLKIWDWDLIFGCAVKAISSLGVRSPWFSCGVKCWQSQHPLVNKSHSVSNFLWYFPLCIVEPVLGWDHLESKGSKAVVTKRRLIGWSHSRKAERELYTVTAT